MIFQQDNACNRLTSKDAESLASDLANWAGRWLVNRHDVRGGYRCDDSGNVIPTTRKQGPTHPVLLRHFRAERTEDIVGLHSGSVGPDSTARWCGIDIDAHSDDDDPDSNRRAAEHWFDVSTHLGLRPILVASNGRGGYHLWLTFREPIPLAAAYVAIRWLVRDHGNCGLKSPPETFPKQSRLAASGKPGEYGNWLRLPGRHHKREYRSQIWNGANWLDGADAGQHLLTIEGADPVHLIGKATRFAESLPKAPPPKAPIRATERANATRYAMVALECEANAVANARENTRNIVLNRAAFSCGQLIGAGLLDESGVEFVLTSAAKSAGLGEREIIGTLRSGINSGRRKPRLVVPQ